MTDWERKCCGTPADEPHMSVCYMIAPLRQKTPRRATEQEQLAARVAELETQLQAVTDVDDAWMAEPLEARITELKHLHNSHEVEINELRAEAQVAILREIVVELRQASWTSADPVEAEVAKGVALAIGRTIERKADRLEAGNG